MDSTVPGVIQKTVVPLLLNYMPAIVTLVVAWITVSQFYFKKKEEPPAETQNDARRRSSVEPKPDKSKSQHSPVPAKSKKKQAEKWTGRDAKQNFAHEWLLTNLKGHTGAILDMDFSANGKFLATCADDRAVYVWSTRDWKEKEHKYIRYNVEYDHASLISWSPDSKAFVYNRSVDNLLEVCKLTKRSDGWIQSLSKAVTFPQGHKDETIGLGISSNGKYIMTCSNATDLILWDLERH
uniref:Transducin beta-like protein 2 n=1 Tax=Lygus hesperus TaxID=30085 RepID=A0A0A9Y2A4_LYGHE